MAEWIIESEPSGQKGLPARVQGESPMLRHARIALAHDWLCGYRGGEAVLESIAALVERDFEPAGLYVMFDDGRPIAPAIDRLRSRALIRRWAPGATTSGLRFRRWLLPRYAAAVDSLTRQLADDHRAQPIDLLISSSSAAIKGLHPPPGVPHLCYCHSPARYIWSQRSEYGGTGATARLRGAALRWYAPRFQSWDRRTAANVTSFLANSSHTRGEIARCYGRDSAIVFPPARTHFLTPDPALPREDFWLVAGALEPYKRIDLAIAAAELAGADLVIVGQGSHQHELEQLATKRVRFLGRVSDEQLRHLYRTAAMLVFPQVEDFGITAVEAQACGCPVLARRAGGALDIVIEGETGAFFDEPSPAVVAQAAQRVPRNAAEACRRNAERFSEAVFTQAMLGHIRATLPSA